MPALTLPTVFRECLGVDFQLSRFNPIWMNPPPRAQREDQSPAPWPPGWGTAAWGCVLGPSHACSVEGAVRLQEVESGVHSLRCSANTGSKKSIRVLSTSRFLPTPILITQLFS